MHSACDTLSAFERWEARQLDFPREYNASIDFLDVNISAGRGDKAAFVDAKSSITYADLKDATGQMANLLSRLGLKREQRVAMIMLDTIDFPVTFWGAIRAGIIPVPLNTLLSSSQYSYILEDARAEVLFVSSALLPAVTPALKNLSSLHHMVVSKGDSGEYLNFDEELANEKSHFKTVATLSDEVAFWLYSSGSTGMPKGVPHVHTSLMTTARNYGQDTLSVGENDVMFSAAKLFFAYGLGNGMSFPMSVGATAILFEGRPTPDAVFAVLKQYQPTIFFGVPTLYAAILNNPACTPENGSKQLRLCISAGEALPEDVSRAWKKKFNLEILDGIGSTELLHIFLSNRPDELRYGTTGKPVSGYEAKLIDEFGLEVDDEEIGELAVKGDSAAIGYWNQREKSRATFEGAWTRTGDKYYRDNDGFYHYCGRTDDMFKVSGIWVSPFEVESALVSHNSVLEAAVVPLEDEEGLTKPKAFVVLKDGFSADGLFDVLKDHVKKEIGNWKYPRWIDFIDDLPKTSTGKIQRFKLRE
jgi:4-hydroxybenzoate-CoA ligase